MVDILSRILGLPIPICWWTRKVKAICLSKTEKNFNEPGLPLVTDLRSNHDKCIPRHLTSVNRLIHQSIYSTPPPPPWGIAVELILREINSTCIPLPHGGQFNKFHCPHEEHCWQSHCPLQIFFGNFHCYSTAYFTWYEATIVKSTTFTCIMCIVAWQDTIFLHFSPAQRFLHLRARAAGAKRVSRKLNTPHSEYLCN